MIKLKSKIGQIGRFVLGTVLAGAALAVLVALGAAALVGTPGENPLPPCEVIIADGTTLRLWLDEARAMQPKNANGVPIGDEPTLSAADMPKCTP